MFLISHLLLDLDELVQCGDLRFLEFSRHRNPVILRNNFLKGWKTVRKASFIFVLVMAIGCLHKSTSLYDINHEKIIAIPNKFKHQIINPTFCQAYTAFFVDLPEHPDRVLFGVLPEKNQISQQIFEDRCLRASIAIYAEELDADSTIEHIRAVNEDSKPIIYSEHETTWQLWLFGQPGTLQTWHHGEVVAKWEYETRLLIVQKCRAIVTLYVVVASNATDIGDTFGIDTDDENILIYAEQLLKHIDNQICPFSP